MFCGINKRKCCKEKSRSDHAYQETVILEYVCMKGVLKSPYCDPLTKISNSTTKNQNTNFRKLVGLREFQYHLVEIRSRSCLFP